MYKTALGALGAVRFCCYTSLLLWAAHFNTGAANPLPDCAEQVIVPAM
jgi:hypothetical protein